MDFTPDEQQFREDGRSDAEPVSPMDPLSCPFADAVAVVDVVAGDPGIEEETPHSHILRNFSARFSNAIES